MQTQIIPVSFSQLSDPMKIITETLSSQFLGKCDELHGYCVAIKNIEVISNIISRSQPVVLYNVEYHPQYFNPCIGESVETRIVLMFSEGLWTEKTFNNIPIGIAVPRVHTHMEWNSSTHAFGTFKVGDDIKVKILSIFFDGSVKKYIAEVVTSV